MPLSHTTVVTPLRELIVYFRSSMIIIFYGLSTHKIRHRPYNEMKYNITRKPDMKIQYKA